MGGCASSQRRVQAGSAAATTSNSAKPASKQPATNDTCVKPANGAAATSTGPPTGAAAPASFCSLAAVAGGAAELPACSRPACLAGHGDLGVSSEDCPAEAQRLATVACLRAQPPGDRFAPITALMRVAFDVPLAFVTLIDQHEVMTDAFEPSKWTPLRRGDTMCEWVLKQQQPEMIIVEDLMQDARFADITAVTGPPHMRFYALAPLVSPGPTPLRYGTLCVVDFKPRSFPASQYQMLANLASLATSELERDMVVEQGEQQLRQAQQGLRRLAPGVDASSDAVLVCHVAEEGWPVVYGNPAAQQLLDLQRLTDGTPFWQLFSLKGQEGKQGCGGTPRLRQLLAKCQPFTLSCTATQPLARRDGAQGGAPPPGEEAGRSSSADVMLAAAEQRRRASMGAAPPEEGEVDGGAAASQPAIISAGSMRGSLQAALNRSTSATASHQALSVTFAPCTAAGQQGAAPPIGIPVSEGDVPRSGRSGSGGQPDYWLATLRSATAAARLELQSMGPGAADEARGGAAAAGSSAKGGRHMMLPEDIEAITLGPLLGVGASGRTYRGTWNGGRVAVKVLSVEQPEAEGRGAAPEEQGSGSGGTGASGNAPIAEAVLSKALAHPHIVPTHAYGARKHTTEGQKWTEFWIVQELCTGGTLAKAIETGKLRDPATGQARLGFVLRTAVEVAGALAYLHSNGVLHGDLTGNNILLSASSKDSRKFVAMVADFGLSRPLDVLSTLTTGTYGTVSHMPPELIIDGQLTSAADVFSFGVVLWEMMSGKRAWERMNALQIINAITVQRRTLAIPDSWPELVQELVGRCLHLDPNQRPTARDLLLQLQSLLSRGAQSLQPS